MRYFPSFIVSLSPYKHNEKMSIRSSASEKWWRNFTAYELLFVLPWPVFLKFHVVNLKGNKQEFKSNSSTCLQFWKFVVAVEKLRKFWALTFVISLFLDVKILLKFLTFPPITFKELRGLRKYLCYHLMTL